jgi:hypothetical protein
MLKLFQSNQPYTSLFFLPVSLALWLPILLGDNGPDIPIFRISLLFTGGIDNPLLAYGLAVSISATNAFLINRLFNRYEYMSRSNYLPGLFYIIYACASSGEGASIAILLCHTMLIPCLSRLSTVFREPRALAPYFECGFWIGLSAIFYPPAIILSFFVLVAIAYTRPFNLREFIMPLAGALIPAVYYASYLFISGTTILPKLWTAASPTESASYSGSLAITFLLFGALLFLVSAVSMLGTFNRSTNKSRNTKAVALIWSSGIIAVSWFFFELGIGSLISFCSLPAGLVFPYFFYTERKSGRWKELPFILLLLGLFAFLWHWQ